ncbi:MAG TPA: hypothetical protein DEA90_05435 [Opitutae bacterium]|nr:hypothetical protein [Puniceicoccaceae bacterium]HBR93590.1 hypothetical protein [Opitutae bacterium]
MKQSYVSDTHPTHYHKAKPWQILAFSVNDTATNAGLCTIGTFLVVMMTDNLVLSGFVAGIIMMLVRVFDGITDPIIGTLIDNTVTRWGKFRPFLLVGSIIINIGIFLLFGGFVHFENELLQYAWIIGSYIFYIFGYTCQTACTKSAQVQLTNDPGQRSTLGFLTAIISTGYWSLFLAFAVKYVDSFEGGFSNPDGYRVIAVITVAVNAVLTVCSILALKDHDRPECYSKEVKKEKIKVTAIFSLIKGNRPLQMLVTAAATNKLASNLQGAAAVYFYLYTVQSLDMQARVSLLGLPALFLGNTLGVIVARRYDKKVSFLFGTWMGLIFGVLIIVVQPFAPEQAVLFLALMLLVNAGTGISYMNIIPMIADVADYEHWKNGRFAPGLVGTTFSFVDKMVSSISGLLIGGALSYIGYTKNMPWSSEAYWTFLLVMLGVPILGHIASIIAYIWYPIDNAFYRKMYDDLQQNESAIEGAKRELC